MGISKSREKEEKEIRELYKNTYIDVFDHFGKCTHSNQMIVKKF